VNSPFLEDPSGQDREQERLDEGARGLVDSESEYVSALNKFKGLRVGGRRTAIDLCDVAHVNVPGEVGAYPA
jgi:hypothetical protein